MKGKPAIEKWLKKYPLCRILQEKSYMKRGILEAMLLFYHGEGATFEKIGNELGIEKPGAWKRWRKGVDAIMRSFYTIELAICAGVLEPEAAELLAQDLSDYASLARGEGDAEELRDRIEERMVKLAKLVEGE